MSRRTNQSGRGRNGPSAPPIHMMPGNDSGSSSINNSWYRVRPPSYQEATGDYTSSSRARMPANRFVDSSCQGGSISATENDHRRIPSPTYHHVNIVHRSQGYDNDGYINPPSSNRRRQQQEEIQLPLQQRNSRQTGSLTSSIERLNGRNDNSFNNSRRGRSSRHGSASPSEIDEGGQDLRQEIYSSYEPHRKNKGAGSKIKKGLESIGFFIIQILD